jgi:hypothetical protein
MTAELARFSLGRVILHVIAMLGDGAFHFHAIGIVRELSWVAGVTALAVRARARLLDALTLYLAQPGRRTATPTAIDLQALSAVLLHGDVLLTEGNTRMAALVKRLTGSPWSHVSMYVGPLEGGPDPRCVVEADIATGVRAVPLSELEGMRVRVLRPMGLHDRDRRRVADWVVSRIGDEYDVAHAWTLARRLMRLTSASRLPPHPQPTTQGAARFVCSTLVAQAFLLIGYHIVPPQIGGCWTQTADYRNLVPRDFENASVFEVVSPTPLA